MRDAGVSILFILLNQITTKVGLLAGFSPLLIAAFPLTVVMGLTCYLFWSVSEMAR
jgi:lipopolysaccharide export LptBFGC system permease protein LptF